MSNDLVKLFALSLMVIKASHQQKTMNISRVGKSCTEGPTRHVTSDMKQTGEQESFLANVGNKTAFIKLLMAFLRTVRITAYDVSYQMQMYSKMFIYTMFLQKMWSAMCLPMQNSP
jgi:hypothetical protein